MAAFRPAASDVSPVTLSLLTWIEQRIDELRTNYTLTRQYYRGEHKVYLTDRLKRWLRQSGDPMFRDNFCEVVVDAVAERLRVTGLQLDGADETAAWLWSWWRAARGDAVQSVVHTEAVMQGDAYILVAWDNDRRMPRLYYQDPAMIVPRYSPETGDMMWASKKWTWIPDIGQPEQTRLNVYYPDRIEKYEADRGVWRRFREQNEDWPIEWRDATGVPLGIPLFHFRNDSLSDDFGQSEIMNVIPLQDLLNKMLVDLAMTADTMAFPQRYTVNLAKTGATTLDVVPGSVWNYQTEGDESYTVGQFPEADLTRLLRAIEMLVQHVAGVSRTPQHLFHLGGNYPSGEALKTAEAGLVNKVKERQLAFGQGWEQVLVMAHRLQHVYGEGQQPYTGLIDITWADPESRNVRDFLEGLKIKREALGISKEQLWREAGYSQDDIAQMLDDEQQARVRDTNIGAAILEQFQRGKGAGLQPEGPP